LSIQYFTPGHICYYKGSACILADCNGRCDSSDCRTKVRHEQEMAKIQQDRKADLVDYLRHSKRDS